MTVVLTGSALTLDELVRVAREGEAVALAAGVVERMARSRVAVDAALARGDPVYGLTTGVGVLKRVPLAADEVARFNRRLLDNHRVAQGPPVAGSGAMAMASAGHPVAQSPQPRHSAGSNRGAASAAASSRTKAPNGQRRAQRPHEVQATASRTAT